MTRHLPLARPDTRRPPVVVPLRPTDPTATIERQRREEALLRKTRQLADVLDPAERPAYSSATPTVAPRRIVVVEDNEDVRAGLSTLLELGGHLVEVAADGPSGLATILASRPDVALVDVGLPGLDGYGVARAVRAVPEARGVMLVALTGYGRPEDRVRAAEAGFDAHLVKPIDEQALLAILARSA